MIETNLVCKSFGTIRALDSVSTSIRSGAVYGIIGSNGVFLWHVAQEQANNIVHSLTILDLSE